MLLFLICWCYFFGKWTEMVWYLTFWCFAYWAWSCIDSVKIVAAREDSCLSQFAVEGLCLYEHFFVNSQHLRYGCMSCWNCVFLRSYVLHFMKAISSCFLLLMLYSSLSLWASAGYFFLRCLIVSWSWQSILVLELHCLQNGYCQFVFLSFGLLCLVALVLYFRTYISLFLHFLWAVCLSVVFLVAACLFSQSKKKKGKINIWYIKSQSKIIIIIIKSEE